MLRYFGAASCLRSIGPSSSTTMRWWNGSPACPYPTKTKLEPTAHNGLVGGSSPPGPTNLVVDLNPCRRSADEIVLASSIVTVIGPTPPGTGVMCETFGNNP